MTTFISRLADSYRSLSILALCIFAFFSSVTSVPRHSPIPSAHLLSEPGLRGKNLSPHWDQPEFFSSGCMLRAGQLLRKLQGYCVEEKKKSLVQKSSGHLRKHPSGSQRELWDRGGITHRSKWQILMVGTFSTEKTPGCYVTVRRSGSN